MPDEEVP
jgi:hypothetical protein